VRSQTDLFRDESGGDLRLYCAGDPSLISRPCVAVVGAREPTSMGAARARRLARELARAGVVVVSGLARGVDTEALTAAIDAGGRVIAVIGTPLDKAYPAENRRLQERIYHEHLLISQFAPGQRVFQGNFPVRNRLMAALTDATAIIEAGETSGTLHQASACVRLERWLFIARSAADDPHLNWPADFVDKPRVRVLNATSDVLDVLTPPPR
jgi:DNA processing protein